MYLQKEIGQRGGHFAGEFLLYSFWQFESKNKSLIGGRLHRVDEKMLKNLQ